MTAGRARLRAAAAAWPALAFYLGASGPPCGCSSSADRS